MPFNINTGVYTPPNGATNAASGQVIQSAVWNTIHNDLSGALTGLAQGSAPILTSQSFHNALNRNGSFDIWQRGAGTTASITVTGPSTLYTADAWYFVAGTNQTVVASAQNPLVPGGFQSGRFQRTPGETGTTQVTLGYPISNDEIFEFRGRPVSLQLVAATGANWSPTGGNLVINVYTGTGSPVKQVAGYTNQALIYSTTVAIAAGTTLASIAVANAATVGLTTNQAEVQFQWTPVGTAGNNDWIQFDDVQLEPHAAPTLYDRVPFDICLFRNKRYYQKTFGYGTAPAQNVGTSTGEVYAIAGKASVAANFIPWRYPVAMRTPPTVVTFNPGAGNANPRDESASLDCSVVGTTALAESVIITANGNASTAVGNLLSVHMTADAAF